MSQTDGQRSHGPAPTRPPGSGAEPTPFPGPVPTSASAEWPAFLERLRVAIDLHSIVAATDTAGRITYANDRFVAVSGYTRDELLGQNHRILKSGQHPDSFYEGMWRTISRGEVWRGEVCNRAKPGHLYWVDTTIVPFLDAEGRPQQYLSLRTEVTRLKETEEALGSLTRELEKRVASRTAELGEVNARLQREIEEHREASEKLAQSESLYRLLFQSVSDYFYTVEVRDATAFRTQHTGGCTAVTGYTPQEFAKETLLWIKMVVPEDRPAVEAQARAALEGGSPPPLEHRIIRKDGELRWIRNTVVVRRDAAGTVVFYDGIISDITPQRLAQQKIEQLNVELEHRVADRTAELKARNDQFRLLFEHAPVGISWVEWGTPDIYRLNERFCQIIGLSAKEAETFENIMAATHPEDRDRQRRLIHELWSGARDRFAMEKRYIHKDGRVIWANLTVVVLRDEKRKIIQQFAMLEDITERREAEERLRRSEQRFRRFVENANEILYSLSPDGHFLYVSPTWTAKLGHPVDEVTGQPVARFIHPDDQRLFWDFLRHVLDQGRSTFSVEYRALARSGHYRWHASSGAAYFDESGNKVYMGVARDVTDRKRSQVELRAVLAHREEMARIIDRSPSVVVLWRAGDNWPVEFVSQNVSQFGYTPEEILSGQVTFVTMLHPEDRDRVVAEVRAHAAVGHHEYSQEYRIVGRDGGVRWIDDRTAVRTGPDGRVTHHEGILTDITSRKEAERREDEARERDLRTAREVQRHLLPNEQPKVADFEVDGLYLPSRHIGGDYYDYFEMGPRRWAFVVADVSGKGASAALVMAACRMALRVEAPRFQSPAALLRHVNHLLYPDVPDGMYISVVLCLLDLDAHQLTITRAGHEAPVVIRGESGAAEMPSPSGLAVGLDGGAIFDEALEESSVPFAQGDILVLYTDGITEATNDADEEFGRERLITTVARERARPIHNVVQEVDTALTAFIGTRPVGDDRTLVIVRMRHL